jgi:hypothetical protein
MEHRIIIVGGNMASEIIGISGACLVCDSKDTTRHHVVPRSIPCKRNVTVPLCEEHKDLPHHVIKQFYFPRELRQKLGKIKKLADNLQASIDSFKKDLQFHNHK